MARQTKIPGQTTEEQTPVDEAQLEAQENPTSEPTEEQTPTKVSNEQLERIEASLVSLHAKLDSFLKLANMTCMVVDDQTPKRWVHDPKLGHVYK